MKPLFGIGLIVLVLGILSLFISIPHSEDHGIKVGDANIGVRTTENKRVAPAISAVMIVAGAGLMIGGRVRG